MCPLLIFFRVRDVFQQIADVAVEITAQPVDSALAHVDKRPPGQLGDRRRAQARLGGQGPVGDGAFLDLFFSCNERLNVTDDHATPSPRMRLNAITVDGFALDTTGETCYNVT